MHKTKFHGAKIRIYCTLYADEWFMIFKKECLLLKNFFEGSLV